MAAPPAEIDPPTLTAPAPGETLTGETIALAGTAEPGSTVEIVIDGRVVGVAPVGNDGTWAFSASVTEPGPHEIGLNTLDPEGQVVAAAPPISLSVAAPPAEIDPPILTAPAPGETLTGETIALAGTAEPGSTVEIVIDGHVVGVAPVGNDGTWAFSAPVTEPGPHEIGLNTLDPEGQVVAAAPPISLSVAAPPVEIDPPTLTAPAPGETLTGETIALAGTAEPGSTVGNHVGRPRRGRGSRGQRRHLGLFRPRN